MCICVSFTTQLEILKKKKNTGLPTSTMFYLAPALVNMDKKCKRTGYFRKKKIVDQLVKEKKGEHIFPQNTVSQQG